MSANLDENRRGDGPREAVEPAWTWEREQEYWERVGRGEIEPDWLAEEPAARSSNRRAEVVPAEPALWRSDDRLYANLRRAAEPDTSWTARLCAPLWLLAVISCFAALVTWQMWPSHRRPGPSAGAAAAATAAPRTKSIEDVRVGERLAGRNPLREQVDGREPDPATWRRLSLRMRKADGRTLWIELLRPVEWIELYDAEVGKAIELDLYEMGAVGQAEVTHLGPCPPIQPGRGAVVTGTFKHAAGPDSGVVQLTLEGETEATGVTDNHAYWSADRQAFVEVGRLRTGERVDTEFGERRVISVTPVAYTGFLYNLETTEHVYRVGAIGTLVHNSCVVPAKLTGTRSDEYREAARALWQSRTGRRAIWDNMDIHHRVPLEWAHKFPRADPNRAANLVGIDRAHHPALNGAWSEFKTGLNGREPTAAEVMRKALEIDDQYGHLFTFLPP